MNLAWQLGRDSGARAVGVAVAALLTAASSAQLALPEPPENEEQPWYGVGLSVETGDIGGNAFARTVTRTDTPFIWSIDSQSSSISAGTPGNSATSRASAIPGKLGAFSRAEASGLFSVAGSGKGFNPVKPTSYGATAGMAWFDTQIDGDADFTAIGLNLELDGSGSMSHFPSFGPRAPVQETGVAVTVQVHYDDFEIGRAHV